MLVIGLTGGIASGKSTVAAMLAELGAVVIDADQLARDVLAPGTPGLAAVLDRFGPELADDAGVLDRRALAGRVFADPAARRDLEAIVHPAVAAGFEQAVAAAAVRAPDTIVVHDVPLLVEAELAGRYHLVLVAMAPQEERIRRAVAERGMVRDAVLERIAAQADDAERLAVADVVVDTDRPLAQVRRQLDALWQDRLVPYEENVRLGRPAPRAAVPRQAAAGQAPGEGVDVEVDDGATRAGRVLARVRRAGGEMLRDVRQVDSGSGRGHSKADVLAVEVDVAVQADATALAPRLAAAGFPGVPGAQGEHANADPGCAVDLFVRVLDEIA